MLESLVRRPRGRLSLLLLAAAAGSGCGQDAGEGGAAAGGDATSADTVALAEQYALATPAGPSSAEPNLTAGPGGPYLSWLEPTRDDQHALRFARWQNGAWGEPRTVLERDQLFVNWADFPALAALDDGTLAAAWLQKSGPATYAYDVRMAVSRDSGRTWSDDIVPHDDGTRTEHGFISLLPMGERLGLVWLDGRETTEGRPMTIRFASLSPDGQIAEPALLDSTACDCCQTDLTMAASGPVAAYRDRTEAEVRDISVVRRVDGRWTEPETVHDDGWVINACPVNGPALAADGSRVAVAWFTGATAEPAAQEVRDGGSEHDQGEEGSAGGGAQEEASPRVLMAFSDDSGASFGAPVRVDGGRAVGRVDLALLPGGDALVAWLERTESGAAVRLRRVTGDGAAPARTLATTDAARASGFPRMVIHDEHVLVTWTQPGEPSRVSTARVPLEQIPGGGS